MTAELELGSRLINDESDCYVIAEIGHNHQGSIDQCKELFDAAKECGADAVKLQKRDNQALFTREIYDSTYNSENAYADTYGAHREFLEFGRDEYIELKRYAEELEIDFFSTAFDHNSADFLADLDLPAFKIASGDLTNIPLIKHIAQFDKPMVISTGGGVMEDIERVYETLRPITNKFCFLQCTAGYPPEYEELNLKVIQTLRERFPDIVIGYSGHDSGIAMALIAYCLGARIVEKHFTLNRALKGTDHSFSLERPGLQRMVRDLRRARIAMGDGIKRAYESEAKPLYKMAKKLVAARDLPAGHVLTADDIAIKTPNDGIPPYKIDFVIGQMTTTPLKEEDTFSFDTLTSA